MQVQIKVIFEAWRWAVKFIAAASLVAVEADIAIVKKDTHS